MAEITGKIEIDDAFFKSFTARVKNLLDFKKVIEDSLSEDTSFLINTLLTGAYLLDASDLHFEAQKNQTKLRIRMDGFLHDLFDFEKEKYSAILGRLKLISGLKLNIEERPQDGRFSIVFLNQEKKEIEARASTLPTEFGETIVLRILNPKNLLSLKELGLEDFLLNALEKEIKKPNGMIIVTGPTGSGKTTTLYAILNEIRRPELKIITIEDPIEYHLPNISQTQVDTAHGYDFANGLRAIVRQDPDVILVGEIRDLETASIAIQASLTGHLVLSTLHTNDAAGTIARLEALGESPVNIAPALNIVIAQRLVRKVCPKCKKIEKVSQEEFLKIQDELKNIPSDIINLPKITPDLMIPKPVGCADCNFTGYKGRVGIFELFLVDDEMENFILKSPSISDLRKKAIEKGMILMRTHGFLKALNGITTIEEVERVVGEE